MGSIKSFEEVKDEVEELTEKVNLLYNFAEALDSRVDTIIPTTSKLVSNRAHTLTKQIEKFKETITWRIIITIIVFAIIASSAIAIIISGVKEDYKAATQNSINNTNDTSQETIDYFQSQLTEYREKLKESSNEIEQLKDRLVFLSFLPAMYDTTNASTETLGSSNPIVSAPIKNWKEYINLFTIGEKVPIPVNIDTNTFRCMDYRTITDFSSWQYNIQENSKTIESGLRVYEYQGKEYYTVALATAYGIDLGNAYKVTLQNGTTFNIMHAEYKHDIRYPSPTDYGDPDVNYDGENTISVIEFIYDWKKAPQGLIGDGEANRWLGEGCDIYGDGCNIVSMEYLGKIWSIS